MGILRFLLAFAVVLDHAGPFPLTHKIFVTGQLAVESFFMVSGFYMAVVLTGKYANNTFDFYWNRFLRIFPTYWAMLLLIGMIGILIPKFDFLHRILGSDLPPDAKLLLLVSNFSIVGSDLVMFFSANADGLYFVDNFRQHSPTLFSYLAMQQAWTLPLELTFYALAPLFVRNVKGLIVVVAISFGIKLWTNFAFFSPTDPWTHRFFLSELSLFGLGALAYHALLWWRATGRDVAQWLGWLTLAIVCCFTIAYSFVGARSLGPLYLAVVLTSLPILFSFRGLGRFDTTIGELSYPIYLCHQLIIGLSSLNKHSIFHGPYFVYIGTVILALLLQRLVAEPLERLLKRSPVSRRSALAT